jgi:hypothetical protein
VQQQWRVSDIAVVLFGMCLSILVLRAAADDNPTFVPTGMRITPTAKTMRRMAPIMLTHIAAPRS